MLLFVVVWRMCVCVPCNTAGTCTTSVRATRKKSPSLVMSWSPEVGNPSPISTMVGNLCCDGRVINPSAETPATTYPPVLRHHSRHLTCQSWPLALGSRPVRQCRISVQPSVPHHRLHWRSTPVAFSLSAQAPVWSMLPSAPPVAIGSKPIPPVWPCASPVAYHLSLGWWG